MNSYPRRNRDAVRDTPRRSAKSAPAKFREQRKFLGPKLGCEHREGEIGGGVSVQKLLNDPRMSSLVFDVLDRLKEQFSEERGDVSQNELGDGAEALAYRKKLEFWAQMFETLLEETLEELDRLDGETGG